MASSGLDELEQTVRTLVRADSGGVPEADPGPWIAMRVGRNDVWKLTHRSASGEACFAKLYRSAMDFRRELAGLQLARRLAEGRDWLMAAEILLADERNHFIVTEALPGVPLQQIVRTALRRGQPRPARRAALEQVRRCLSLVVDWIGLLQSQPPGPVDDLQDNSSGVVAERIAVKLERLGPGFRPAGLPLSSGWSSRVAALGGDTHHVLTHGDLSFGNVLFYNGRLGIVDFENMGLGPGFRDIIWIQYGLEQCNYCWYYRDSTPLLDLLDAPRPDDPLAGLYRMEFVIDHLLILEARLSARPRSERVLGLAERRWARREFLRLSRLLASV